MTLFLLLTFCAAAALVLALAGLLEVDPLDARLRALATKRREADPRGVLVDEQPGLAARALTALAGRRIDPRRASVSRTRRRLVMAGYRRPSSLPVYLGSRVALAALLPLLLLNSPLHLHVDALRLGVLVLLVAGLGLILPSLCLDRLIRARQRAIEQGLPDALDVLVVCVEAGLGLNASIARVASEYVRGNPALAEEFELVALETRAGRPNVEALRGLAERTGLLEVGALATMLIQTERFGTSIADALRVHAGGMRRRRMQRAEEGAAKAPLKMLFPAGIFIFPATLMVIAGPGLIRLIEALTAE